jgi:hypothetical protein
VAVTASATEAWQPETTLSAPTSSNADEAIAELDAELIEPLVVTRNAG